MVSYFSHTLANAAYNESHHFASMDMLVKVTQTIIDLVLDTSNATCSASSRQVPKLTRPIADYIFYDKKKEIAIRGKNPFEKPEESEKEKLVDTTLENEILTEIDDNENWNEPFHEKTSKIPFEKSEEPEKSHIVDTALEKTNNEISTKIDDSEQHLKKPFHEKTITKPIPSEKPSENSSELPIEPRTEIGSEIIDKNIPDMERTKAKKFMKPRLPLNVYYYPVFIPHYSWGYAF